MKKILILATLALSAQGFANDKESFWDQDLNHDNEMAVMSVGTQMLMAIGAKSYVKLKGLLVTETEKSILSAKESLKKAEGMPTSEAEKIQKLKDIDLEKEYFEYQKDLAKKVNQKEVVSKFEGLITKKNAEYIQAHAEAIVSADVKAAEVSKFAEQLKSAESKMASIKTGHLKWVKWGANLALIDALGRLIATVNPSTKDSSMFYLTIPGSSVVALIDGLNGNVQKNK